MAPRVLKLTHSLALMRWGGGRCPHPVRKIAHFSATFCYDYIMITLATGLVQQFYTYWQIHDNQASLTTSLKKFLHHFFRWNNFKICIWETDDSYIHTGPKVVTTFRSFGNQEKRNRFKIRMLWGFCQFLWNYNQRPTGEVSAKLGISPDLLYFNVFGRNSAGCQMHNRN
jgi:hypothetical protein